MSSPRGSTPRRRLLLPAVLALALVVRVVFDIVVPPSSDVYYYLTEGVHALLSGMNPYDYTFNGIPVALVTPGSEHVFAYLPFTLYYLVPFSIAGDVRIGFIFADLLIGTCLFFAGGRWRLASTLFFLFLPYSIALSTALLNVTVIAIALLSLFMLLEARGRGLMASLCLGLALGTVQFIWLVLPLVAVYYLRQRRWREPLLSVLVAAAVIAPFLLLSPGMFLNEVLFFQFGRSLLPLVDLSGPSRLNVNPSMNSILETLLGVVAPLYVKVLVELAALLAVIRVTDLRSVARNAFLLVAVSVFVLPNDFFWSYLELPLVLFLFWEAMPNGHSPAGSAPVAGAAAHRDGGTVG